MRRVLACGERPAQTRARTARRVLCRSEAAVPSRFPATAGRRNAMPRRHAAAPRPGRQSARAQAASIAVRASVSHRARREP
ncbi:hypothetical protein WT60_24235 [Burkholderia sp. MSMB617WGS]|uniref:Uncharacterized protein n=1 Tax=Burkholderia savannae TaxID=1637837 RepID=A0ABR5T5C9_9BURK|nr:hypothetical protein WT60_24235 [Burkholderia sp. MSMB617WGS]KWZ38266.1 hypothetical protein WS72_25700 [Burkholderia savannae]